MHTTRRTSGQGRSRFTNSTPRDRGDASRKSLVIVGSPRTEIRGDPIFRQHPDYFVGHSAFRIRARPKLSTLFTQYFAFSEEGEIAALNLLLGSSLIFSIVFFCPITSSCETKTITQLCWSSGWSLNEQRKKRVVIIALVGHSRTPRNFKNETVTLHQEGATARWSDEVGSNCKPLSAIIVVLRVRSRTGPPPSPGKNRSRRALGLVWPDLGKRTPFIIVTCPPMSVVTKPNLHIFALVDVPLSSAPSLLRLPAVGGVLRGSGGRTPSRQSGRESTASNWQAALGAAWRPCACFRGTALPAELQRVAPAQ